MTQSYVKASVDGLNGSGKTCTLAQLACGLALEYSDGGSVVVFDSSDRWSAWKAHIFDVENVPIEIVHGTSIAALQHVAELASSGACSVLCADDLTVPWMEGLASFAYENGNLTFDRRQQLINEWNKFVGPFQQGEFHALAAGRLGYQWEQVENEETGDRELLQGNSKFNAGGSANFGYECVLELEMRRRKRRIAGFLRGKQMVEYVVDVVKDANGILAGGSQFVFNDFPKGRYQKGDYKRVLDVFRAHVEFRQKLVPSTRFSASSKKLIVAGRTSWSQDQIARKGYLEEFEQNLDMCFPSGEGKSKLAKQFRNLTLEYLNGHMSWSRMEEECKTADLAQNVFIVKNMRKRIEGGEIPTDGTSLRALLDASYEAIVHPGRDLTMLEVMGARSLAAVAEKKNGSQPDRTWDELVS